MKKTILLGSIIGCIILYALFNTRTLGLCDINCGDWIDKTQNNFLFFPILLSFSLITYKMKPEVFRYWWRFSRIAIPIILAISILINLQFHHTSGGLFNLDNIFDLPILFTMYAIFIVGSLIQIYRGYRQK